MSGAEIGWLVGTVAVYVVLYLIARRVQTRFDGHPLANTVLLAALPIMVLLIATDTPYERIEVGGQVLLWFLGPATVALAVPLYRRLTQLRASWRPILAALAAGSVTAVLLAVGTASLLGADAEVIASLAPKSVTTPIAMGISEEIGGLPALSAAFVIATGIIGAMLGGPLCSALGIRDPRARGLGMGVAAHGIGTARAFHEGQTAGSFSTLGMALNGILTALLLPALWLWLM